MLKPCCDRSPCFVTGFSPSPVGRPPVSPMETTDFSQIPSDLVVKSQITDIIDLILQLIRHQNGIHRLCRSRTPRGAVLSTSEVQWATTTFDGVWNLSFVIIPLR